MEKHLQEYLKNYLNNMSEFKYDLGILGLGYVGLPLAIYSIECGLKVFGYDINTEKVSKLNNLSLIHI